jgi:hypothetical protein
MSVPFVVIQTRPIERLNRIKNRWKIAKKDIKTIVSRQDHNNGGLFTMASATIKCDKYRTLELEPVLKELWNDFLNIYPEWKTSLLPLIYTGCNKLND